MPAVRNGVGRFISLHSLCTQIALLICALCFSSAVKAQDATVLLVQGLAEVNAPQTQSWQPLRASQSLAAGSTVRTLQDAQLALVLRDQTQLRLNQNTTVRIQSLQAGDEQVTTLGLEQGRMWAQVKQSTLALLRAATSKIQGQRLRIVTPTATIGIRGTSWELAVGDSGTTRLIVIDGEVEMANAQGSTRVLANEQAIAELGKAPVKSVLTNAKDRVQWVTAYTPAPKRWVSAPDAEMKRIVEAIEVGQFASAQSQLKAKRPSIAAALLSADLALYAGQPEEAITALTPYSQGDAAQALALALHMRALLVAGRMDDALELSLKAAKAASAHPEAQLAQAEALRLSGRADEATQMLQQLVRAQPQMHEAWFNLGRILLDRDDIEAARTVLAQASALAPNEPSYAAESATLLTQAGELKAAQLKFDNTLKLRSDDYTAWTGQGILQLKTGQPQQALESFTNAGVLEPRFSRAQLYTGVASYQLGDTPRALQAIRNAAELDGKDPLPYLMLGLIHNDANDFAQATVAAQAAQERMPYLKSANQLLNDQKGSANVGSALANRGLEEWAQSYAAKSYNPFWAGSAFFAADRYADGFNKNSELLRGYLLDPLSFGASNRFSSLVPVPGHYGSLSAAAERANTNLTGAQIAANGLLMLETPTAYSLSSAGVRASRDDQFLQNGRIGTLNAGLGTKLRHDVGLFYFGSQFNFNTNVLKNAAPGVTTYIDGKLRVTEARHDIGLSFKPASDQSLLVKVGTGKQTTSIGGNKADPVFVSVLNDFLAAFPAVLPFRGINPATDSRNRRGHDAQLSHSFSPLPTLKLSWGFERSVERQDLRIQTQYASTPFPTLTFPLTTLGQRELNSTQWFASARGRARDVFEWQVDLMQQKLRDNANIAISSTGSTDTAVIEPVSISELNPRLGMLFSMAPDQQMRLVYQRSRRPFGSTSLAPSDTLSIPLEDRLVNAGGQQNKLRIQYDWQLSNSAFMQAFAQQRKVSNLSSPFSALTTAIDLVNLDTIRPRQPVIGQRFQSLEATPSFDAGMVRDAGVAGNFILSPSSSITARYISARSKNTGSIARGLTVPYIPRHLLNVVSYWQPSNQWVFSGSATYRSSRFADELNLNRINAGWNLGLTAFWESTDKRWSLETSINNIQTNKQPTIDSRASVGLVGTYKF